MIALKPWLVLALIFIGGAATGAALTVAISPNFSHPPGEQQRRNHWMMILTHRLNLSSDQQAQIKPIVAEAENKIQTVHHDEIGQIATIMASANQQISPLLTPDQRTTLNQLETEREQLFRDHVKSGLRSGHEGMGTSPPTP